LTTAAFGETARINRCVDHLKFLVNGEWRDPESGSYMPITNSSTGEVIGKNRNSATLLTHLTLAPVALGHVEDCSTLVLQK
jgi:hypothetical protein